MGEAWPETIARSDEDEVCIKAGSAKCSGKLHGEGLGPAETATPKYECYSSPGQAECLRDARLAVCGRTRRTHWSARGSHTRPKGQPRLHRRVRVAEIEKPEIQGDEARRT